MRGQRTNESKIRTPIGSITFGTYNKEDIEAFSQLEVTQTNLFNNGVGMGNSFYDPRFGPTDGGDFCPICGQHSWNCNGHFGHISLPRPIYHPLYAPELGHIMQTVCLCCNHTRCPMEEVNKVIQDINLIERGIILQDDITIDQVEEFMKLPKLEPNSFILRQKNQLIKNFLQRARDFSHKCANCRQSKGIIKLDEKNVEFYIKYPEKGAINTPLKIEDIKEILVEYQKCTGDLIKTLYSKDIEHFFVETISVTPSKFRPAALQDHKIAAHPMVTSYLEVLKNVKRYKEQQKTNATEEELEVTYKLIQQAYNVLLDKTFSKSRSASLGVRQVLEKKEGLFRRNLMGKRVNFSARSVITPDPYVATDEVGVPEVFAMRLSYPEKVTQYNADKLSEMIVNGPDKYPGANFAISPQGNTYNFQHMKESDRSKISKQIFSGQDGPQPWVVGRHVINGDVVLLNRQPTLHRVSILGMKVKVLPNQKTLRMHYSNCASFNADFDGDEINMHLLQNELSRSEALNIALSSKNYVTPTAGEPIRGLIQDHIDSSALLTIISNFYTRVEFEQMLYSAFAGMPNYRIEIPLPAIFLPQELWSGKQVISALICNLTRGQSKIQLNSSSKFSKDYLKPFIDETGVVVLDGELLVGVLDKAQLGASAQGLIHSMYELYGSQLAGDFLSMLSRLFTYFMQTHGLTCSIDDMILTRRGEHERRALEPATNSLYEEMTSTFEGFNEIPFKPNLKERFDKQVIGKLSEAETQFLDKVFPAGLMKKFPHNRLITITRSGAKGSAVNLKQMSCLLGPMSLEGKRVPLMATGKTLPMFKRMDLSPAAGGFITGRFLTGLLPHEFFFHSMAGREGLTDTAVKTAETGYLQRCLIKSLEGLRVAYDGTVRNADNTVIEFLYGEDGLDPVKARFIENFAFMDNNFNGFVDKVNKTNILDRNNKLEAMDMFDADHGDVSIQSVYPPHLYVGSLSLRYERMLKAYKPKHCDEEDIQKLAILNYFSAGIEPGEPVGITASEAIGEPATQMTLNTFHLAGYGGANVTLGIPRLKEILIVATRKPKTPMMVIPLKKGTDPNEFASELKKISLYEVTREYNVKEEILQGPNNNKYRQITVRLKIDDSKMPKRPKHPIILQHELKKSLKKELKRYNRNKDVSIRESIDEEVYSQPQNITEKAEEMGADFDKTRERKTDTKNYGFDEDEKNKEEEDQDQEGQNSSGEETDQQDLGTTDQYKVTVTIDNIKLKLLLETIVEDALKNVMVNEVIGINAVHIGKPLDEDTPVVETEGVNLFEVLKRSDVFCERFYTNDIAIILNTLGIEAAREAIIKEVRSVFNAYAIHYDVRHLYMVADYVTNSGDWIGMSRKSMEFCASAMQQMSFETSTHFMIGNALRETTDSVRSPSASLSVGNVVDLGTGMCEILVPFE